MSIRCGAFELAITGTIGQSSMDPEYSADIPAIAGSNLLDLITPLLVHDVERRIGASGVLEEPTDIVVAVVDGGLLSGASEVLVGLAGAAIEEELDAPTNGMVAVIVGDALLPRKSPIPVSKTPHFQ